MTTDLTPFDRPGGYLEPRTFEPIGRADTDSWTTIVADVIRFAEIVNDTEFVPKGLRGSMPATAAAMLYGREVGLPPMTALSSTHVVEGRPAISAEAMRALVFAAGHEIAFDVTTGAECTMRGRRRGTDAWTSVTWSLSMARAAGLLTKQNWAKYPRAMLVARATAELCRLVFPDVIHGFAAVEESDEAAGSPETAAAGGTSQPPTAKPVRRRSGRVASSAAQTRPAAAPVRAQPRPVDADDGPPLPGEAGFEEDPPARLSHEPEADETRSVGTASGEETGDTAETSPDVPDEPDDEPVEDERATIVVSPDDAPPIAPRMISRAQQRMMLALFGDLDLDDRDERLDVAATIVGRRLTSSNDLSADEASGLIDTLSRCKTSNDVYALVEHIRQAELPIDDHGDDEP